MPECVLAYHVGNMPDDPEIRNELWKEWEAWVSEHQEDLIEPQKPLGMSKTVSSEGVEDGGGPNPLQGFSILKADDMDAALEVAKSCPFLKIGTIEVAQIMQM